MKFVYSPEYEADIGPHVFPTQKYRLVMEKLIKDGLATKADFLVPEPATREQLALVHTEEFLDDLLNLRRTQRTMSSELPISESIVRAYVLAAGGTILACRQALEHGQPLCCHIGGGFHHGFADHAEGFCYINDIAVGIRTMQKEGRIEKAAVLDCDLHQGNGTAHIFQDDASVFTYSIHQENNYPFKQKSDLDVGLLDFIGDDEYLAHLQKEVPHVLDSHKPQLVIYVAGADPYKNDQLGSLQLTLKGLQERDRLVFSECLKRGIPAVSVTAGGYARQVSDTVLIHYGACAAAHDLAGG